MDIRTTIRDYFDCWRRGDRAGARALLSDQVVFRSPAASCNDAETFLRTCWAHHRAMDQIEYVHELFDDPYAYVVYRTKTFTSGELMTVRDGRISAILVTPSPTMQ